MSSVLTFDKDSPLRKKSFIFGTATAAQQIEGGRHALGRVDSVWDRFCDTPGKIAHGDKADVGCNHLQHWQQDLSLVKDNGFDAYRFSIAWPRIISDRKGSVNQAGLDFYERILDKLLHLGIKPFVTLYHWDLPDYLFNPDKPESSGWLCRDTAYHFSEYASVVADRLGDRISHLATFNEPWCSAILSYDAGVFAPGLQNKRLAFVSAHHQLLAHGMAMPMLREIMPNAQLGIVLNSQDSQPASQSEEDQQAAVILDNEFMHMYLQPLLEGSYPDVLLNQYPDFFDNAWQDDLAIIKQPMDYLGLNYYTRVLVESSADTVRPYKQISPPGETTAMGWEIYPQGLTNQLLSLHARYQLPPVFITENGMADEDIPDGDVVEDFRRCDYFNAHLKALEAAIVQGVNVEGYFAWSLMDNFEWAEGYAKRFGLFYVDYQTQQRFAKQSAEMFKQFLLKR